MKPAPFQYHRVTDLSEATALLAGLENVRLLSGGQSLMPMMNLRYVAVDHLIDLNPVAELSGIEIEDTQVRMGAMTRQRTVLDSDALAARAPIFREALAFVGHIQTRNRGTIGGSLAHMDPAAELMGLAALLNARITVARHDAERYVAIADYVRGYMTPDIEPDEVLASVMFDLWPAGHGWDFREFAQRHGDFAIVGVGTLLDLADDGRVARAALVLIGVDEGPVRLFDVETMLAGEKPTEALFRAAGDMAAKRDMSEDALVSADYRKHLTSVLVERSLAQSCRRAKEGGNA